MKNNGNEGNDGNYGFLAPRGDYRTLLSFQKAEVVYDITGRRALFASALEFLGGLFLGRVDCQDCTGLHWG